MKEMPTSPLLSPLLYRKSNGQTVNAVCFKDAQAQSLVIFMPKGLDCHPRTSFYTGTMLQSMSPLQSRTSKGAEGGKMIRHPLYSPDSVPADLFLRQRAKSELTGILLSQEIITSWDGVMQIIAKDETIAATRQ
jgi:hypothetical protein